MALKNSEFRSYAVGAQAASSSGNPILIATALIAMVGLGGAYAYKIGFFSRTKPVPAVASAPASKPAEAAVAAASAAPSIAAPAQAPALAVRVDPRDANDALARVMHGVMKDGGNFLKRMDYAASFDGAFPKPNTQPPMPGAKTPPAPRIDPKDIVANCMAEAQVRYKNAKSETPLHVNLGIFTILSEIANCSMVRGQPRMCESKTREQVLAQIKFYDSLRSDAMKAVGQDMHMSRLVSAAFDMGVHGEINKSLRNLGTRGLVKPSDFSLFPSKFVTDTIGESKGVKNACV